MQPILTITTMLGLIAPLAIGQLRRILITPRLLELFKRILPTMSATERDALEAGTTWWDADLFSGKPDWSKLLASATPSVSGKARFGRPARPGTPGLQMAPNPPRIRTN